jgi:hypothetical protein
MVPFIPKGPHVALRRTQGDMLRFFFVYSLSASASHVPCLCSSHTRTLHSTLPESLMFFHKKAPHKPGCMVMHLVLAGLLLLAAVASLLGVYLSHFLESGLTFGTSAGSLSLIAFTFTVTMFLHQLKACMTSCEICSPGKK